MKTPPPNTLEEVRAIRNVEDRLVAVIAYLNKLDNRKADALKVRDDALRVIDKGPTEVSRLTGLSVSTIKLARSRPR